MLNSQLFQLVWRIVNMMLTAIVLIALTRRVGWIDWKEQFAVVADFYAGLRDDALAGVEWLFGSIFALFSIPWSIDLPSWSGDAFLLWWSIGQAYGLSVWLESRREEPPEDWFALTPITVVRYGLLGPLLPLYYYSLDILINPDEEAQERMKQHGVFGELVLGLKVLITYAFLRRIVPMLLVLATLFWVALAINFYI